MVLPAHVVEVALAKAAGWALDPAARAGTDPDAMWQTIKLLQHSLCLSRLEGYSLDDVASILWSLASVLGEYSACWDLRADQDSDLGVEAVAGAVAAAVRGWLGSSEIIIALEGSGSGAGKFSVLASLLWGYAAVRHFAGDAAGSSGTQSSQEGELQLKWRQQQLGVAAPGGFVSIGSRSNQQQQQDAAAAGTGLDKLARRAAELIRAYGSSEPVSAVELADVAWALSSVKHRSPATAQLAEAVAHEVYRQLSNRSSLQSPFEPAELIKVVRAYADMGLVGLDGSVARMMDAVGGHVGKRIRGRHVGAITRPRDCAELLMAFADSGHNSVVVPEFLQAVAMQISREVSSHNLSAPRLLLDDNHEGLMGNIATTTSSCSTTTSSSSSSGSQRPGNSSKRSGVVGERFRQVYVPLWERRLSRLQHLGPEQLTQKEQEQRRRAYWHWSPFLEARHVISILSSYVRMGFYPGVNLMDSLLLAVSPQLPYMPPGEVSELLELLAAARHVPGPQTLALLASAAVLRRPSAGGMHPASTELDTAGTPPPSPSSLSSPRVVAEDGNGAKLQQGHPSSGPTSNRSSSISSLGGPAAGDGNDVSPSSSAGSGSSSYSSQAPAMITACCPLQQLASLWALVMMGWRPDPAEVEQVLLWPVLLDHTLDLTVQDVGRVMSLLCVLPRGELTIQRFGLAAVKLRDALASTSSTGWPSAVATMGGMMGGNRSSVAGRGAWTSPSRAKMSNHNPKGRASIADPRQLDSTLLATGVAMALLGSKGWEMAEQVLSAAHFRRVEEALQGLLLNPYDGADDSYLAEITQGLKDIGCCDAGVVPSLIPVDALRRRYMAAGEAAGESGGADDDDNGTARAASMAAAAAAPSVDEEATGLHQLDILGSMEAVPALGDGDGDRGNDSKNDVSRHPTSSAGSCMEDDGSSSSSNYAALKFNPLIAYFILPQQQDAALEPITTTDDDDVAHASMISQHGGTATKSAYEHTALVANQQQQEGNSVTVAADAAAAAADDDDDDDGDFHPSPSRAALVLHVCSPTDCANNSPSGVMLWGWSRVRWALFEACMVEPVRELVLTEGNLRKARASPEDIQFHMQEALSKALVTHG